MCIRTVVQQEQARIKMKDKGLEETINEELNQSIACLSSSSLSGDERIELINHIKELRREKAKPKNIKGLQLDLKLNGTMRGENEVGISSISSIEMFLMSSLNCKRKMVGTSLKET